MNFDEQAGISSRARATTAPDGPSARHSWHDRWPPEVVGLLTIAIVMALRAPLNTDVGWYLVGARRLLQGDRLYVDLFDVNPPLVFWLMSVPALVGRWLAVRDDTLVGLFVVALLIASTLLALKVLSFASGPSRALRCSMMCAFFLTLTLVSTYQVAQREQIATILLLPYMLLASLAAGGLSTTRRVSVMSGVFASVAFALKPFFLVPWLAIELAIVANRRQLRALWRADFVIIAAAQSMYVLLVLVVTPEYLSRVVPVARATYGVYGMGWSRLVWSEEVFWVLLCGCVAIAAPRLLGSRRDIPFGDVFGAATLGFLVGYLAQKKGFIYHDIPMQAFGAVAAVTLVGPLTDAIQKVRRNRVWRGVAATLLSVTLLLAAARVIPASVRLTRAAIDVLRSRYPPAVEAMVDTVDRAAAGEPIFVLSTSVWPAFPIVNLGGATWPYHYPCLWPLPALYATGSGSVIAYRRPEAQGELERAFFRTVLDDLIRMPPRLLVVERGTRMQAMRGRDFDYLGYFSSAPEFAALFKNYRPVRRIAAWEFYELDPSSPSGS